MRITLDVLLLHLNQCKPTDIFHFTNFADKEEMHCVAFYHLSSCGELNNFYTFPQKRTYILLLQMKLLKLSCWNWNSVGSTNSVIWLSKYVIIGQFHFLTVVMLCCMHCTLVIVRPDHTTIGQKEVWYIQSVRAWNTNRDGSANTKMAKCGFQWNSLNNELDTRDVFIEHVILWSWWQ